VLRDFTDDDQAAVRTLVLDGMRERWGDSFDPNANPDLDDVAVHYIERGAEVVVVEIAGDVVGTGVLRPERDRRGRILRVSVRAEHRRQGIGRQIVEELVNRARRRGMSAVDVLADTPWTSATALYRACGFECTHRDATDTSFTLAVDCPGTPAP
jgi:ribosomal protein S18 acetylase RimI-like enzyme